MDTARAQDVCDIEHLLTEYCHRVDRGSAAEVAELHAARSPRGLPPPAHAEPGAVPREFDPMIG